MNREDGVGSHIKTRLLCHALSMGHVFRCFRRQRPTHALSAVLSFTSRLMKSRSRMFGSQVTDIHTLPDPTFFEPYDCNKVTTDSGTFSVFFCNFFQLKL